MSKRKIKTFHQLVEEYKKEIAKNPKEMEVIYDKIDRRHENRLLAISKQNKHKKEAADFERLLLADRHPAKA